MARREGMQYAFMFECAKYRVGTNAFFYLRHKICTFEKYKIMKIIYTYIRREKRKFYNKRKQDTINTVTKAAKCILSYCLCIPMQFLVFKCEMCTCHRIMHASKSKS